MLWLLWLVVLHLALALLYLGHAVVCTRAGIYVLSKRLREIEENRQPESLEELKREGARIQGRLAKLESSARQQEIMINAAQHQASKHEGVFGEISRALWRSYSKD